MSSWHSAGTPEVLGGYRIVKHLSEGGMGEVLLGLKEGAQGFEKQVAIKILRSEHHNRDDVKQLFFSEARLAARLSHPHVCQVFDFGEEQGLYYIVMEFVDGISVRNLGHDHRRHSQRLPPELAGRIVADAARGLHQAHTLRDDAGTPLNVVHRDVSPANLMVTWDGCTKVLDFGIAKSRERATATQHGVVRGKPAYMSPEQARGDIIDLRSDLFALGTVLLELLTNNNPFQRESVLATMAAIADEPLPPLTGATLSVPEVFARVVQRALARERNDRFASADSMARALEQAIDQLDRPATATDLADYLAVRYRRRNETAGALASRGRSSSQQTLEMQSGASAQVATIDSLSTTTPLRSSARAVKVAQRVAWSVIAVAAAACATLVIAFWGVPNLTGDEQPSPAANDASRAPDAATGLAPPPTRDAAIGVPVTDADRIATPPPGDHPSGRGRSTGRSPRDAAAAAAPRLPVDAASPAAAIRYGTVSVLAEPYGQVRIDGEEAGPTPVQRRRLAVGSHQIEVFAPDTGTLRRREQIEILEGIDRRVVVNAP